MSKREQSTELVHEEYAGNVAGRLNGAKPAAVEGACASAAFVVTETIYQQAYVAVPLETRGSDRGMVRR